MLNRDSAATSTLLRDGGQVFSARCRSPAALQQLVRQLERRVLGHRRAGTALAATIRAFPAFLVARETRSTVSTGSRSHQAAGRRAASGGRAADPGAQGDGRAGPRAREPDRGHRPTDAASKAGVPALERFLDDSVPLADPAKPYLGDVVPVLDYINNYRREIAAFFANSTATTRRRCRASASQQLALRADLQPGQPGDADQLLERGSSSNRGNPYMVPGGYASLASGLPVFGGYLCTSNPQPAIGPTIAPASLAVLRSRYYTADPRGRHARPRGCSAQATTGQQQAFPNYNRSHEHGRLCFCGSTYTRRSLLRRHRHNRHGARRARRRLSAYAATGSTPTREATFAPNKAGSGKTPSAVGFTETYVASGIGGNRTAPLTDIKTTIYGVDGERQGASRPVAGPRSPREERQRLPEGRADRHRLGHRDARSDERPRRRARIRAVQPVPARVERRPGQGRVLLRRRRRPISCAWRSPPAPSAPSRAP